ncbi:MAG: hypothetical protein ACI9W2_004629, partial [Gammaproteobacteria bacterium]
MNFTHIFSSPTTFLGETQLQNKRVREQRKLPGKQEKVYLDGDWGTAERLSHPLKTLGHQAWLVFRP